MLTVRALARPILAASLLSAPMLVATPAAPSASGGSPTCFGRPATIVGSGYLLGTPGDDVIVVRGVAEVHALGGDDRICGAALAYGGEGHDRIAFLRGGSGDIELMGMAGNDRIVSNAGGSHLDGGRGSDVLIGGDRDQWVVGGPGDDRMRGGRGDDHLNGGGGRDRADGGSGNDRCTAEVRVSCHR